MFQDKINISFRPVQKGLDRERSRVKKAFLCTRTMGVLHREPIDSLITSSFLSFSCNWLGSFSV